MVQSVTRVICSRAGPDLHVIMTSQQLADDEAFARRLQAEQLAGARFAVRAFGVGEALA